MITVGEFLKTIGVGQRRVELARLDDLLAPERAAVEAALAKMPRGAKVDLGRIVNRVRQQAVERANRPQHLSQRRAFEYFLCIATGSQLRTLKRELERGASVEEAMAAVRTSAPTPADPLRLPPDVQPDDEDDERPAPRRRVRRARTRASAETHADAPGEPETPVSASLSRKQRRHRSVLGPRAFGPNDSDRPRGCPDSVSVADYDGWAKPAIPSWLSERYDEDEEAATYADAVNDRRDDGLVR